MSDQDRSSHLKRISNAQDSDGEDRQFIDIIFEALLFSTNILLKLRVSRFQVTGSAQRYVNVDRFPYH
ncbi:hypothetical protein SAMN04487951_10677 [Vreelandella arcis]|uniref:Uncharacterized protein n=1 Tax=Vreelandella arcis TaxID=416873 RepID=A0A1H0CJ60_9GAMM|nr:hypothetical protein SAMN04487951_10677 [Halomonas arcis]